MRSTLVMTVSLALLSITACGKSSKKTQAAPACGTGVDQTACNHDVQNLSVWALEYQIRNPTGEKDQSGKPIFEVSQNAMAVTEFIRIEDQRLWRRTITLKDAKDQSATPRTLFIEGRVLEINDETIRLTMDRTSCDGIEKTFRLTPEPDADGGRVLYYQRNGNSLNMRTRPFQKLSPTTAKTGNPLANIFGSIMNAAVQTVVLGVTEAMVEMTTQMFTFGLVRDQFKDGSGLYHATTREELYMKKGLNFGVLGCAEAAKGVDGFAPSSPQALDW